MLQSVGCQPLCSLCRADRHHGNLLLAGPETGAAPLAAVACDDLGELRPNNVGCTALTRPRLIRLRSRSGSAAVPPCVEDIDPETNEASSAIALMKSRKYRTTCNCYDLCSQAAYIAII